MPRTIVIEIDIDTPGFAANFDLELAALTSHIEAQVHMWEDWTRPVVLMGTDRKVVGLMRFRFEHNIGSPFAEGEADVYLASQRTAETHKEVVPETTPQLPRPKTPRRRALDKLINRITRK